MCATGIKGAARKQQIPHDCVAQVAFQTRDASKSGNKPQAQLRKSKARHFVGDDDVASEGELKSPAKASSVNRRNGDKWGRVDCVHNRVNALQKAANRSEEHTSELQSRLHLVCRLLLEKKKKRDLGATSNTSTRSSSMT